MMYQLNTTKLYYIFYFIRATCFDSYIIIFRPFTVTIEIQPLSAGDKSLNVRQEYNINIGKISLTKCNISA